MKISEYNKSNILYVITCSNHKQKGGNTEYDKSKSLIDLSDNRTGSYLIELRKLVLAYIKDGSFSRAGIKLIDLPYNRGLIEGPDFGEKLKATYLQARKRYIGRLYREISEESWVNRNQKFPHFSGHTEKVDIRSNLEVCYERKEGS